MFFPQKIQRLQKSQECALGLESCPLIQFCSQASEKRGLGAGAFVSPTLLIQERVAGNMMQVLLVFLQKVAVK